MPYKFLWKQLFRTILLTFGHSLYISPQKMQRKLLHSYTVCTGRREEGGGGSAVHLRGLVSHILRASSRPAGPEVRVESRPRTLTHHYISEQILYTVSACYFLQTLNSLELQPRGQCTSSESSRLHTSLSAASSCPSMGGGATAWGHERSTREHW